MSAVIDIAEYQKRIPEYFNIINATLPQAKLISDERKMMWIEQVLSFEPQRILWHIKRLSGIGGSEIGTVLAPFVNEYDRFNQPRDIFMDKMMITLPQPPNGHMRRGTELEDRIRDEFRKKFQLQPNTEALALLEKFRDPKHPWRVGNPDDYGLIGKYNWMIDYKCPMPGFAEKYESYGISFGYQAQLHHYTKMARDNGIKVDGLLLCSWDMENWCPDVRPVEMRKDWFRLMDEAGDWMWNDCIMRNQMPEHHYEKPELISGDDEIDNQLRKHLEQFAMVNLLANKGYSMREDIKKKIAALLENRPMGNKKMAHDIMNITSTSEFDENKALVALAGFGLKSEDFTRPSKLNTALVLEEVKKAELNIEHCYEAEFDVELITNTLIDKGMHAAQFHSDNFKLEVTRSAKAELRERVDHVKNMAEEVATDFQKKFIRPGELDSVAGKRPGPKM